MRKWELWSAPDGTALSFFPTSDAKARAMALAGGEARIWETEADSLNEAMRARNEYLGYGPYTPDLREDGTPYPEDEDDVLRREKDGELFDAPWSAWCSVAQRSVVVPCDLEVEEVVRRGGFEYSCPACGGTHTLRFGPGRAERQH